MAPPLQGKLQFIPAPPFPEFYMAAAAASPPSGSSEESRNNMAAKSADNESLPPARLDPPPTLSARGGSQTLPESFTRLAVTTTDAQQLFSPPEYPLPPALITTAMPVMAPHPYTHHFATVAHPHTYTYHPTIPQPAHITAYPSLPPGVQPLYQPTAHTSSPHTLNVYHACRICHRSRSEKFHLQNPVIPGSKPDASDICRRCRVKSVVEVERVVEKQKEPIKLGVACLVPNEDYVTKEKAMEEIALSREGSRASRSRAEQEEEGGETSHTRERVVYRYVSIHDAPAPASASSPLRAEVSVENLAAMNLMNDQTLSERNEKRTSTKRYVVRTATDTEREPAESASKHSVRLSQIDRVDSKRSAASARDARSGTASNKDATPGSKSSSSSRTAVPSDERAVQPTGPVVDTAYLRTDTDIRRIARDEIERYRQAERLIAAHPDPYAHGRMVPADRTVAVERRIEKARDSSTAKPWEEKVEYRVKVNGREVEATDMPPMPKPEPLPAFARSSKSSVRSEKQRDPSVDSRLWYHEPKKAAEDELPDAQPASGRTEVTERGRRTLTAFEREALEQEELDREQKSNRASVRASTRPREPAVSARVRELKEASDREARGKSSDTQRATGNATEVQSVHGSRTGSQRSNRRDAQEADASARELDDDSRSARKSASQVPGAVDMPSPRQYLRTSQPQVPATSDGTWYADRIKGVTITRSQNRKQRPDDDEKTVWPTGEPTRPAASERTSTVKGDWDWEYSERTIQPASRPASSRPFDDAEPRYTTETESVLRHQKPSTSNHSPLGTSRDPAGRPAEVDAQPHRPTRQPAPKVSATRSERERGPYMRLSEESTHVHFASKVEFSPTPPGSDEYLPEYLKKSQHRRQERRGDRVGGSGLRQQLNGPDDRESAEELFEEYERRRAGREETPEPESRRGEEDKERARLEAAYDAPPARGEEHYAPSLRGGSGVGSRRGPLNDEPASAVRSQHSSRPASAIASSHAGSQHSRRPSVLSRALSESPSRESLKADFKADVRWDQDKFHAELRRHEAEKPHSISADAWEDDGKGPYREDQQATESMDAFHGSGFGGSDGGRW